MTAITMLIFDNNTQELTVQPGMTQEECSQALQERVMPGQDGFCTDEQTATALKFLFYVDMEPLNETAE
jgi:hypothetical protein